jgi:hypothetical protein
LLICITPGPAIEVTRDQLLIKPGSFAQLLPVQLEAEGLRCDGLIPVRQLDVDDPPGRRPGLFPGGLIRVKRQPGRPALVSLVSKRAGGADA